jgi:hypothetical protein
MDGIRVLEGLFTGIKAVGEQVALQSPIFHVRPFLSSVRINRGAITIASFQVPD